MGKFKPAFLFFQASQIRVIPYVYLLHKDSCRLLEHIKLYSYS